jgi:hypothetical protein
MNVEEEIRSRDVDDSVNKEQQQDVTSTKTRAETSKANGNKERRDYGRPTLNVRRRVRALSTPVGVGAGLLFFGPIQQKDKQQAPAKPKKQDQDDWGIPAEIVVGEQVYKIRISNQSLKDLQDRKGNCHDYHGFPLKKNGQPLINIMACIDDDGDDDDDDDDDNNEEWRNEAYRDVMVNKLQGYVR